MRARLTLCLPLALAVLGGCATRPANDQAAQTDFDKVNDPFEPTNRFFYKVNDALDAVFLKPIALAYVNVVPAPARTGVHNVLSNLDGPVRLANDMLQGKPRRSGDTLMRFLINSTAGVGGVFDPATGWGYPFHENDFGLTLAVWGVGEGPFLYLPILGPTNPRDATGYAVDAAADPFNYVGHGAVASGLKYGRYGLTLVDVRSNLLGTLSGIKKTSLDPYATFRSLYRQNRASAIRKIEDDKRSTPPTGFGVPGVSP